jgi:hypothetical protein
VTSKSILLASTNNLIQTQVIIGVKKTYTSIWTKLSEVVEEETTLVEALETTITKVIEVVVEVVSTISLHQRTLQMDLEVEGEDVLKTSDNGKSLNSQILTLNLHKILSLKLNMFHLLLEKDFSLTKSKKKSSRLSVNVLESLKK